ncbi:hypothetical protein ES332_A03G059500v1 [Gossypium tomentosum]|uniref:Oxysterol-binding protein n=1 Tax=Gossypium tomentosum TaxID=34277 RepID=A0A5D2R3N5_GOSTO|nr:hypothetical protein ES332_A03G059500v1 [Gossypium tomentosum]
MGAEGGGSDYEASGAREWWRAARAGERESYWKMMVKYIGSDVTSMVTLPVIIFEPMTMLQKMAELMEYSYLLDLADKCEDPYLRLVSHHPPMSAGLAENEHFTYDITSKLKTKFLGNSLEVYPVGSYYLTCVTLKRDGVVLDLVPPPTKVNNLIFGRTRVDSPREMIMTNLTTGDKVVLYFQPCGWFGSGRYEVDGKWNESTSYQPCDTEGEPHQGTELKEVWHVAVTPENDKFQYTYFAHKINSFDTAPKNLLASDSHLRPDRFAVERGDLSKAGAEKSSLEEMQRAEKRTRKASGHQFTPRWFDLIDGVTVTRWGDLEIYSYNGKYPEHWATVDSSDSNGELDIMSIEFNPWQYGNLSNK